MDLPLTLGLGLANNYRKHPVKPIGINIAILKAQLKYGT